MKYSLLIKCLFVISICMLVIGIIGCSESPVLVKKPIEITPSKPTSTPTNTQSNNISSQVAGLVYTEAPPVDSIPYGNWGSFGSLIVPNYKIGNIVDKNSPGMQPYYLINRIGEVTEYKIIETGRNAETKYIVTSVTETTAKFKLVYDPYPDLESLKIKSDLPTKSATFGDYIKIDGYDSKSKELSISGLMQGQSRNLTVNYTFNETTADIPIKKILHNEDVKLVNIVSDLASDNLKALSYNRKDNTLRITGFTPIAKRTAKITYLPDLIVTVSVDTTQKSKDTTYQVISPMVANWVTFSSKELVLAPESVTPVRVSLDVPSGTIVPNKWMFWIHFEPQNPKGVSTGVQIADPGYYNTFKVEMN